VPYAESSPLVIEDLALDGPGQGEALVELVGAGLCHSDLSTIDGSRARPTPMVLGHEASGMVREAGAGVVDLKPDEINLGFDRLAEGSAMGQLVQFSG